MTRSRLPRMHTDSRVSWNCEANNAMQAIGAVCIGGMTMRRYSVRDGIRTVMDMRQCGVTVDIIVCDPGTYRFSSVADKCDLMSVPIEQQFRHDVPLMKSAGRHGVNTIYRANETLVDVIQQESLLGRVVP